MIVIVASLASARYTVFLIAATVFPLVLYLSSNPRLLLWVGLVFSAPIGLGLNFRRMEHIGGASSFSIDLVDLFMIPLLVFLVRDFASGYRRGLRVPPISLWWFGMIMLGVMTLIEGPYRQLASFEVFRMLKLWLLFMIVVNECVREKHFYYAALALAANVVLNVSFAIIQYVLRRDLGLQILGEPAPEAILGTSYGAYLTFGGAYRVGGLMAHPNLFGAYLALLIPIFVALLYAGYGKTVKTVLGVVIGLGLVGLLLSLSRSAWLAFAAGLVLLTAILFAHPALRSRSMSMKFGMLITFAAGLLLMSGPILKRLTESDPGALDFRFEWLGVAWSMVQDRPLLGVGLNSFAYNIVGYVNYSVASLNERFGNIWPSVHNIYMLVWSEQGTVGLLLFLGLHAHLLWLAISNARYTFSDKVFLLNVGALCGIVAIMVDGMASFFVRVPACGKTFWMVAALIVAAHYWNRRNALLRAGDPAPSAARRMPASRPRAGGGASDVVASPER